MNNSLLVVVIASGIAYGTPLLFASLGELLAERSGVLNLGVEGMMLVGAVLGFWGVQRTGSLPLAIGVAAIAGAAMAAIHAFLVVTLRANQIVSGLALTIFAGAAGLRGTRSAHSCRTVARRRRSSARSCSRSRRSSTRRGCASPSSRST